MVIVIVQREVKCTIKSNYRNTYFKVFFVCFSYRYMYVSASAKVQFVEKLFVITINTPFATNLYAFDLYELLEALTA